MSADDWRSCPVCQGLPDKLRGGYKKFYGKVDEKEYERLKAEYKDKSVSNPVRVDYEYDLNPDLTIFIGLHAICGVCGAEWHYKGVVR